MRIVAGTFRSRTLSAPAGFSTRPTSDRLRETLFNVLSPRIQGAAFLDLYAGSGAVGLEAFSRGASPVTFVERAPVALRTLRANIERLGIRGGLSIQALGVAAYLRSALNSGRTPACYGVVFLDPPYDAAHEYEATLNLLGGAARSLLAPGALIVAEHRRKQSLEDRYGSLQRTRLLQQGDAALSFYQCFSVPPDAAPASDRTSD